MSKKNIWIINEYAGTPYHGMEFRHYYIGKELKNNYNVTVISSSYSHLFKKLPEYGKENVDGVDYLWLKMFNYGTSHDRRRVLKWFFFMLKCFFLPFMLKKPDVILVSPMAPFPILPAWVLSKIYKAKLIYEVKDIWPLSLIELGGFSYNHPFIKLMSWFEKFAILKSDEIVSNLQNYEEHMVKDLKLDRTFSWISNGVDLNELYERKNLPMEIKDKVPDDKFIVGYTGTIGVANAINDFLEAIDHIKNENIYFVIVGDGQEKNTLVNKYKNNSNIIFIDSIEKKQVQDMLNLFDICYIGLQKENLFKYGVSPNKLFDYMYSSKPIIYAIDSGENNIVKLANCGLSVEAQNSREIANAIMNLYNMDKDERIILGENGKRYVLEHFTYEKLSQKYIKLIEGKN